MKSFWQRVTVTFRDRARGPAVFSGSTQMSSWDGGLGNSVHVAYLPGWVTIRAGATRAAYPAGVVDTVLEEGGEGELPAMASP